MQEENEIEYTHLTREQAEAKLSKIEKMPTLYMCAAISMLFIGFGTLISIEKQPLLGAVAVLAAVVASLFFFDKAAYLAEDISGLQELDNDEYREALNIARQSKTAAAALTQWTVDSMSLSSADLAMLQHHAAEDELAGIKKQIKDHDFAPQHGDEATS